MSIIDSIQLSGNSYDVKDKSATTVVSLTQQEYDALPSSAKTANILYNITDATAGDLTQYWTSAQTQSAITEAVSGKQETLVSGTNIKTINNESILGSGNIDIQGGGKAIKGGRGITVTTGETADTVSFNLPISAGTGTNSIKENYINNIASGVYSHVEGSNSTASGERSHAEGYYSTASGSYSHTEGQNCYARKISSHAEGTNTDAKENYSHTEGFYTIANNQSEHASGQYNVSSKASTTFGDSGNTLFSVGNGTSTSARHNAFEIRQNGDIYLTSGSTDIKLQDYLGGGGSSYTAGTGIDITNDVISVTGMTAESAFTAHTANTDIHVTTAQTAAWNAKSDFSGSYNDLTDKPTIPTVPTSNTAFTNDAGYLVANDISGKTDVTAFTAHTSDTDIHVTSAEKASWNAKSDFSGSYNDLTNKLSAGTNITIVDNVISATGGGGGGEVSSAITSGDTNAVAGGAVFDAVVYSGNTYTTELTFDANGYAENWVVGQSAITIDVSGYTSNTSADYHFEDSNGLDLGRAHIFKVIGSWGGQWSNNADNCTITTDGDTATTATITNIPSGTVKIRRTDESNPPKAIINGNTPETWIKDALDDHRDNTTVHITAAERTYWNNKSNFSGSYNDLTDKPIPDSALNVASTNAVQNQALYSELRIDNGGGETETTLVFDGYSTTNYPQGCTRIKVEDITSYSSNNINFFADGGSGLGYITVSNWGSISVDTSNFQGASYEISGSTVIISYPTVTTVTKFDVANSTKYTYKAITSSTTPLKDQVVANTTALGGLSLVKLTQAQYDALVTKDSNTLYVIVN